MKPKKVRGSQKYEGNFEKKSVMISLVCGVAVAAALMAAFSLMYTYRDLPLDLFRPLGVAVLLCSSVVSAFVCASLMNQHGMMWGGICGGILFLCLLVANLLFPDQPLGFLVITKCVMMTTAGMIGGILGVNFRR